VIFASARKTEDDRINSFDIGGDDFLLGHGVFLLFLLPASQVGRRSLRQTGQAACGQISFCHKMYCSTGGNVCKRRKGVFFRNLRKRRHPLFTGMSISRCAWAVSPTASSART
jgi:hypothetical protein